MSHGSLWLQPIKSTCGGGNRRVVQIQPRLTARKFWLFYTGVEMGSRRKEWGGRLHRFFAHGTDSRHTNQS